MLSLPFETETWGGYALLIVLLDCSGDIILLKIIILLE